MGLVRILLPLPRAAARLAPAVGRPLLGAALTWCVMPRWVLLRPPPAARRLAAAEELVGLYRSSADPDRLARALALQAFGLLLSRRYEEACTAADASFAMVGARPSAARSAFAVHLRAQALVHLGRYEEALEPARDAIEFYRRIPAPKSRDRVPGSLAGALRTHALVLGVLGRTGDSVAVYQECATLLRAMSARELATAQLVRPRVLVELVGGLRALGRYEEALATGPEAREAVHGPIAWSQPEILLALRVELLTELAACENAAARPDAARDTAEEAVTEAHRMAGRFPVTGERVLALALDCLAFMLHELQAYEDELTALRELADLHASFNDDPALATALDDIARCLGQTGDRRAALAEGEHAVTVARRAAEHDPEQHEPQLARLLANLSLHQQEADEPEPAVASAREAVAMTRRLAETDWTTYQPLTARRLRILAQALRRTGEFAAAVTC
ncbi:tetratricopeptide repeat protein [Streptomyces sp. TLI_185]|uniref:tetratricopeptide repeat protein n=1 Tax=Streptomyces sp. TLI_185 TaxID=2485151 RepID=UPI000F4FE6D6|nr:tetratricopeptide repeat protein [Streptomyces sp. TLI_185]RPF38039.1 tetratricopeptide repeat protein [Streptomyces sp. TLI_185]